VAIVADLPGTTRDRVFAFVTWQGRELIVIDTGGWQTKPYTPLEQKVKQQSEAAITQADAIVFLVDAKDGIIAADEEIADLLRQSGKPIILAVNKVDSAKQANQVADFYHLGIGEPAAISAYHNRGIDELMDNILSFLPSQSTSIAEPGGAKLAIVGRPNVGKSTLLNTLLQAERAIVHDSPGTTRDSLDATVRWDDKEILLVDTAGIKRRGRVDNGVDYYSLLRAIRAINRCDVALLLIDASEFITAQDMHIAGYIIDVGKGIILLVNKWDLVSKEYREGFKKSLEQRLRFAHYMPIIYISAQLGRGVNRVLLQAWNVCQERQKRIPGSEVNELVKQVVSKNPPPHTGSRRLRIIRAYQDESRPATFILQVNNPRLVHSTYQRYLENEFRQGLGFRRVPLKLIFTRAGRKINTRMKEKT